VPATEMVRVTVIDGELRLTPTGAGRGAWFHPTAACVAAATRRGGFARALRCEIGSGSIERLGPMYPEVPGS